MTTVLRPLVARVLVLVTAAACVSSTTKTTTAAPPPGATTLTFAPSLGVDVGKMRQTPTGLLVRDIDPGQGNPAVSGDFVRVEYTLWLTNGTRIDGTDPGDKPFEFQVGQHQVIAGWEEGIMGMRAGAHRQIVVPPALGYGMRTRGNIPGNSVLVFDLKVVYVGR